MNDVAPEVVTPYPDDGQGPAGLRPWRDARPFHERHPALAGVIGTVILGSLAFAATRLADLALRDQLTRCQVQLVDEKARCVVCSDAHGVMAVSCDWSHP